MAASDRYTGRVNNKSSRARSPVHIVAAARTPFGRFFGALSSYAGHELAAWLIDQLLEDLPPVRVDELQVGVGMAAGGIYAPARQLVLASMLPDNTPSTAVDRACASGMTALGLAWQNLCAGGAQLALGGGFESLSRMPGLVPRMRRTRPGDPAAWEGADAIHDPLLLGSPLAGRSIAAYTGDEALARGVSRQAQDDWAVQSHARFFAAEARGFFQPERRSLPELATDEGPRPDLQPASLAKLKTLYGGPTVTAGNAPGLSDGAAFLALADDRLSREVALTPLGQLLDYVSVAGSLTASSWLPAVAIQSLLKRNQLALDDLDLLEINEAYAATVLVSLLELADGDPARAHELQRRTNIHGGAIAIGHPLGASGARIVMHLVHALRQRGGGRGVAAICGAYGQAEAMLVEVR